MSLIHNRVRRGMRGSAAACAAGLVALGLAACGSSDSGGGGGGGGSEASAKQTSAKVSGGEASTGVTADTIKLGFVIEDYPKDNTTPFFFRTDGEKAAKALVDDLNAKGGIAGRKIVPVFKHLVVGFDPKPAREACLTLTKQDKVFAVIAGYATVAANDCFIKDAHTPVIDTAALSDKANASYGGYHMTASPTYSRTAKDWVYGARDLGLFDKAKGFKKVGVVSETCEADIWDDGSSGIKHWLDTVGVKSGDVSDFRTDCTLESLLANHQKALLKHKQEGATTVMIAAQPLDRNYTALALKQGFKPKYVWGDFHWATQAANAQSLNQDAIDGSYGITAFRQDIDAPAANACSDIIAKAGMPAFKAIQGDLLVMNNCTALNIFKAVAEKAGKDLTQASFVKAAPTTGKIDSAVELSVDFTGDTSGGEQYQVVKWNKGTTSWVPEGAPKPSTYQAGQG